MFTEIGIDPAQPTGRSRRSEDRSYQALVGDLDDTESRGLTAFSYTVLSLSPREREVAAELAWYSLCDVANTHIEVLRDVFGLGIQRVSRLRNAILAILTDANAIRAAMQRQVEQKLAFPLPPRPPAVVEPPKPSVAASPPNPPTFRQSPRRQATIPFLVENELGRMTLDQVVSSKTALRTLYELGNVTLADVVCYSRVSLAKVLPEAVIDEISRAITAGYGRTIAKNGRALGSFQYPTFHSWIASYAGLGDHHVSVDFETNLVANGIAPEGLDRLRRIPTDPKTRFADDGYDALLTRLHRHGIATLAEAAQRRARPLADVLSNGMRDIVLLRDLIGDLLADRLLTWREPRQHPTPIPARVLMRTVAVDDFDPPERVRTILRSEACDTLGNLVALDLDDLRGLDDDHRWIEAARNRALALHVTAFGDVDLRHTVLARYPGYARWIDLPEPNAVVLNPQATPCARPAQEPTTLAEWIDRHVLRDVTDLVLLAHPDEDGMTAISRLAVSQTLARLLVRDGATVTDMIGYPVWHRDAPTPLTDDPTLKRLFGMPPDTPVAPVQDTVAEVAETAHEVDLHPLRDYLPDLSEEIDREIALRSRTVADFEAIIARLEQVDRTDHDRLSPYRDRLIEERRHLLAARAHGRAILRPVYPAEGHRSFDPDLLRNIPISALGPSAPGGLTRTDWMRYDVETVADLTTLPRLILRRFAGVSDDTIDDLAGQAHTIARRAHTIAQRIEDDHAHTRDLTVRPPEPPSPPPKIRNKPVLPTPLLTDVAAHALAGVPITALKSLGPFKRIALWRAWKTDTALALATLPRSSLSRIRLFTDQRIEQVTAELTRIIRDAEAATQ